MRGTCRGEHRCRALRGFMETKFKKMVKMMEHAFTAASFAEEGELETADALMRESRRVLLALKAGQVDPKTLKYAVNTAKRVNARLDILYVTSSRAGGRKQATPLLTPWLQNSWKQESPIG